MRFTVGGPAGVFSDAIFPLSEELDSNGGTVYAADWGTFDALSFLHRGKLALLPRWDEIAAESRNPAQDRAVKMMMLDPNARIVSHVKEREVFVGQSDRLEVLARGLELRKTVLKTIPDSNGRPVFEIFRYVPR